MYLTGRRRSFLRLKSVMEPMNPFQRILLSALLSCLFFTSCVQRTYYQSPLVGSVPVFRTMPVASDSVKAATYVNGTIALGGMNQHLRDDFFSFHSGLYRSHVTGNVRVNYGAAVSLGTYHVDAYGILYPDTASRVKQPGTKFFGAYGGYAGISAATPMGRRGEWRYIGLEGTLFNEWGDYYRFRKELPDSSANSIDKRKWLGSLGLSTELVFKRRSGNKFGMKFIFGSYLRSLSYNNYNGNSYDNRSHDNLLYFSAVYHATVRRSTGFVQLNIATHATNVQLGLNYRL